MNAAEDHFAAHGYAGSSLSAIAASVSISKSSLLHHYPSKATLYLALLDRVFGEVMTQAKQPLDAALSKREQLIAWVAAIADWILLSPKRAALLVRAQLDSPQRGRAIARRYYRPLVRRAQEIASGRQTDRMTPSQVTLLMFQITGALVNFATCFEVYAALASGPAAGAIPPARLTAAFRAHILQSAELILSRLD